MFGFLLNWVAWGKKQTKNQHNLENTLLSNESLTGPPPQPGSAHSCVCYMQALCWCASEVLEKGRRHLEEGLQAASPFTAGKRTWIAEGPRPEGPELRRKSLRAVVEQDLNHNGRSGKFRHSLPRWRGGPRADEAPRRRRAHLSAGCFAACAWPAWSWKEERGA